MATLSGREPKRRPRTKTTDVEKKEIITLATNNPALTHQDIADITDVNRSTVTRVLQTYNIDKIQLDNYKNHRGDIFAGLQHRLIVSCTDEDIKRAPMGSRILAAAQLYDKERLERGQSTENVHQVTDIIRRIKAQDELGAAG